jgi:nucleotide-binding universal stress UspA family protein
MRIIVGYIRSPEGQAALDAAIAETKLRGGQLLVLHSMRGGTRDESRETLAYRDELEAVEGRLQGEGIPFRIRELVRGQSPAEDMVEIAEEEQADLIVIGLRRRSPVAKLVLGSNAQNILLRAHCPVLAVKASERG